MGQDFFGIIRLFVVIIQLIVSVVSGTRRRKEGTTVNATTYAFVFNDLGDIRVNARKPPTRKR